MCKSMHTPIGLYQTTPLLHRLYVPESANGGGCRGAGGETHHLYIHGGIGLKGGIWSKMSGRCKCGGYGNGVILGMGWIIEQDQSGLQHITLSIS